MQTLHPEGNQNDQSYLHFLTEFQVNFDRNSHKQLFTTDPVPNLWEVYLKSFPPAERQHHNCHACRRFIERYGNLVTIDATGNTEPVFWGFTSPCSTNRALAPLYKAVSRAKVTGIFISSLRKLGEYKTGSWRHLSVNLPFISTYCLHPKKVIPKIAEAAENYALIQRTLAAYTLDELILAERVCDKLYRSEKITGPLRWFINLYKTINVYPHNRNNLVWRAVAAAPVGYCHLKNGVLGTLLDDIKAGKTFEQLSRSFADKLDPLKYQRPTAAPTIGQISAAEKLFAELNLGRALERRFAFVHELPAEWRPIYKSAQSTPTSSSLFSHLLPSKTEKVMEIPTAKITWVKFSRDVLPAAEGIYFTPKSSPENYCAITTAVHADAPPILQWDSYGNRNQFGWYMWAHGSYPSNWNLSVYRPAEIELITKLPPMYSNLEHFGQRVIFIIKGAQETKPGGLGLFPETLRSELHGVRSVIEAHSQRTQLAGLGEPHAAGIMVPNENITFTVRAGNVLSKYIIDRWE